MNFVEESARGGDQGCIDCTPPHRKAAQVSPRPSTTFACLWWHHRQLADQHGIHCNNP